VHHKHGSEGAQRIFSSVFFFFKILCPKNNLSKKWKKMPRKLGWNHQIVHGNHIIDMWYVLMWYGVLYITTLALLKKWKMKSPGEIHVGQVQFQVQIVWLESLQGSHWQKQHLQRNVNVRKSAILNNRQVIALGAKPLTELL